ncbi:hypothetical protein SK128_021819, partial [Halocaridina rubra]
MEGRVGGSSTSTRNKCATLPGYRVGSVRYGVRLAPPDAHSSFSSTRRSSEGDITQSERSPKCNIEGDTNEESQKSHFDFVNASDSLESSDSTRSSFTSTTTTLTTSKTPDINTCNSVTQSPPSIVLKEAHSLLNHTRSLLTVPSHSSSSLPPVSPRPHSRRRSFNTFPRPWVAPQANHNTNIATNSGGGDDDDILNRSFQAVDRCQLASTDGGSCTTTNSSNLKISTCLSRGNGSSLSSLGKEPRLVTSFAGSAGDTATYRSEATILVSRGDEGEKRDDNGIRSLLSRRRGVGTLSLSKGVSSVTEQKEDEDGKEEDKSRSESQMEMGATAITTSDTAPRGMALVEEVKAGCLPPSNAKYTCCVAGRSPRQLLPRHATMFSYPGPPRPTIPEEPDSAHLTSDQCGALSPVLSSFAHGITGHTTVLSSGRSNSVASGGSGHGDRVAPPAPVTVTSKTINNTTTSSSTNTFTTTTTTTTHSEDRNKRKNVRPRPEIPDHLYRRWAALLPPHTRSGNYQYKQKQETRGPDTIKDCSNTHGIPGESTESVTAFEFSPPSKEVSSPADSLELQADFFQNIAQHTLGIPSGGLGGGRREGGRGPPPSRPPRSRQDHLEKLRKCTERLKTPSPDKKALADSGSSSSEAAAVGGNFDSIPPRLHKSKKRSNEPRSVINRHPSLGKSPSLPPNLPSNQPQISLSEEESAHRISPIPRTSVNTEYSIPSSKREDEDLINESIAKLPPLPKQEPRLVIPPRVIPFRSASVSQVDVRSDGSFFLRSSKSPTSIRLYPFCKDYWGSNTLPRCKPQVTTVEREEGGTTERHHLPLGAAASIGDMTNVGGKGASSASEKLESKSKSESELSVAGLNNNDGGGSPKVDLQNIRDNLLTKKGEAAERQSVNKDDEEGKIKYGDKIRGRSLGETRSEEKEQYKEVHDNKEEKCFLEKFNNERNQNDAEQDNREDTVLHQENEMSDVNDDAIVGFTSLVTAMNVNIDIDTPLLSALSVDLPYEPSNNTARKLESKLLDHNATGNENAEDRSDALKNISDDNKIVLDYSDGIFMKNDENEKSCKEMLERKHNESVKCKNKDTSLLSCLQEEQSQLTGNVSNTYEKENAALSEGESEILKNNSCIFPPGGDHLTPGGLEPSGDALYPSYLCQEGIYKAELCQVENQSIFDEKGYTLDISEEKEGSLNNTNSCTYLVDKTTVLSDSNVSPSSDRRQIECQVLQKEPRLSQCLVIKSGTGESGELDAYGGQGATSECRVVRSRPRLPREDSDGDSGEREASQMQYMTQVSDEGIYEEEVKSPEPRDSSDSSSQDSVGLPQEQSAESTLSNMAHLDDVPVRTGSRRRRKLTEEGSERSLTYPPPRKNSQADSIGYSSVDSNGLRSLATSGGYGERGSSEEQRSSFSLADSYLSETSQPSETHPLLLISDSRTTMDRAERKKKHHSDPSCERRGSTDALLYLSEPHLGKSTGNCSKERTSSKGVVSQASTDSEGRDERLEQPLIGSQRVCTPQVLLSGHESDGSDYPPSRTPLRNSSPIPYFPDSDSGEKSAPRSPHGPQRYSKRPLRGPYGEMLEAEMSKSKTSSTYLSDDTYLRVRDAKSCSPRPPSPVSPTVMIEGVERPSLAISGPRSLDDSALRINYSDTPDRISRRKISEDTETEATSPVGPAWESDGECTLSPLSMGPMHHRTASSPSKLFSEGGFTSEEEQELVDYYSAAERFLSRQSQQQQQRQQQHRQQQPQLQQQSPQQIGETGNSEARQTSSHEHRHSHKRHR